MSIYKHRNGTWYISIVTASGQRIRRSAGTKDKVAAQELHDKLAADSWRVAKLNERRQYTFDEAALKYLESLEGRSNYRNALEHVKYWREHFGGKPLSSLTSDAIEQALPTFRRSAYGKHKPLAAATKNRYLASISKVLNDAVKRGWLDSAPYVRKLRENNLRESFMTKEQASIFLSAIEDGWMKDLAEMALMTGMRAGEILSLEWNHVNLERGLVSVIASKAKSGTGRPVPLNSQARQVLARRKGLHPRWVFARVEQRTHEIDRRVFKRAARAAGLPDNFRWHDLRHAWASWHAQAGTPLLTLQRLGGWKTVGMLDRYAHLSADDLMPYSMACEILSHSEKVSENRPHLRLVGS